MVHNIKLQHFTHHILDSLHPRIAELRNVEEIRHSTKNRMVVNNMTT